MYVHLVSNVSIVTLKKMLRSRLHFFLSLPKKILSYYFISGSRKFITDPDPHHLIFVLLSFSDCGEVGWARRRGEGGACSMWVK